MPLLAGSPRTSRRPIYFAKALDLRGTGTWITVQDAIPIMLHIGWNTIAKEQEKALYSAVYKRMQMARRLVLAGGGEGENQMEAFLGLAAGNATAVIKALLRMLPD